MEQREMLFRMYSRKERRERVYITTLSWGERVVYYYTIYIV